MAESSAEASGDAQVTFKVKTSGDKSHTITMSESATVLDLKTKLAGEDYENVPAERQRLIYSGRVMKNDDTLATYKIKPGNTVHMVKSAASNPARAASAAGGAQAAAPSAVPTNMAAGTAANNLLAGLTGARFAGQANLPSRDMFGADGGMGAPPNEDQMADMLSNPAIAQTMNEALNNPDFVNYMIQSNPMLASMPNAREMLQSPAFRSMMTNPESLRMASRLRRVMGGGQGATPAFPAPGATDTTPAGAAASDAAGAGGAGAQAANPFGAFPPGLFGAPGGAGFGDFGGAGAGANPFAALFNPMAAQAADPSRQPAASQNAGSPGSGTSGATSTGIATPSTTTQTGATPSTGSTSPPAAGTGTDAAAAAAANPFAALFGPGFGAPGAQGAQGGANPYGMPAMTPEQLQQMMQLMGMGGGTGMGGGMGAFGVPPAAPPDNRPPEERYADQLRQLNDMGFFDFDRNVSALRRSGGSVQGAVEYLLSNVD